MTTTYKAALALVGAGASASRRLVRMGARAVVVHRLSARPRAHILGLELIGRPHGASRGQLDPHGERRPGGSHRGDEAPSRCLGRRAAAREDLTVVCSGGDAGNVGEVASPASVSLGASTRAPATLPRARPTVVCVAARRRVRCARRAATSENDSAKVVREHASFSQRKRRTRTRSATAMPCIERS